MADKEINNAEPGIEKVTKKDIADYWDELVREKKGQVGDEVHGAKQEESRDSSKNEHKKRDTKHVNERNGVKEDEVGDKGVREGSEVVGESEERQDKDVVGDVESMDLDANFRKFRGLKKDRLKIVLYGLSKGKGKIASYKMAGIAGSTLSDWGKREKWIEDLIEETYIGSIVPILEDSLVRMATRGNVTAAIFALCNLAGDRWKDLRKMEHTGTVELGLSQIVKAMDNVNKGNQQLIKDNTTKAEIGFEQKKLDKDIEKGDGQGIKHHQV